MNPEQSSSGPLQVQSDPDSSAPDADPGQRSLNRIAQGCVAVEIGGASRRRKQTDMSRRFSRSVRGQVVAAPERVLMTIVGKGLRLD